MQDHPVQVRAQVAQGAELGGEFLGGFAGHVAVEQVALFFGQGVAQRAAEAKAREEKRVAAEQKRRERVEMEKLQRKIAAEEKAKAEAEAARLAAEEAERKRIADAEAAEILAFEQKARRDLKYAARKARQSGKR